MSDFQKYLDGALKKVSFAEKENNKVNNDYDVFEEIRGQLIKAREEAGLTQKELARLSGLTQSNIKRMEATGRRLRH